MPPDPWPARQPLLWGVLSGLTITVLGMATFPGERWVFLLGAAFGILNWSLWRPGGPGHRWRRKLIERDIRNGRIDPNLPS